MLCGVASGFSIAHVTPHPWGARHEINSFVERTTGLLAARGHRVLIIAPARTQEPVRRTRRALRNAGGDLDALLGDNTLVRSDAGTPVLAVGEALAVPGPSARHGGAVPVDVARTIEQLVGTFALDFVHVHEPFAPSTASVALRHSRSLNVGTFHAPTERLLSTQLGRRVVELFFGRLDARTASYAATQELMNRYFPANYRVVTPGCDPPDRPAGGAPRAAGETSVRIAFVEEEERAAQRLFLRALRRLDPAAAWEATVVSARGASSSTPLRAQLRERVRFLAPGDRAAADVLSHADVVVCASDGTAPAPGLLARAIAAGAAPLASRLPIYEEILAEGERGLLFEPRDIETMGAQLGRLVADTELRERLSAAGEPLRERLTWQHTTDGLEQVYEEVAARRHEDRTDAATRRRVRGRRLIDVDLHMHTDHSHDCATPVEVLLATARQQGLGAIAITDHNEISGAIEAQAKAEGVKVILAEEVKTAQQGEVIGLFISERIERGMTLAETVAEIKRQGGLVYVPHPFDRMHSVPDYEHLLPILDEVDAIEVFNPRVAIGSFNEEAARFAAKYRIVPGAGSDAHVPQGLGSVRVRMRDFDAPEEFMASLREAEIITKPTSLIYVQALKFLQTKATPPAARQASRQRRVRRATRNY
jgi:glycosyltransferase involved in cell wall biosynthesis